MDKPLSTTTKETETAWDKEAFTPTITTSEMSKYWMPTHTKIPVTSCESLRWLLFVQKKARERGKEGGLRSSQRDRCKERDLDHHDLDFIVLVRLVEERDARVLAKERRWLCFRVLHLLEKLHDLPSSAVLPGPQGRSSRRVKSVLGAFVCLCLHVWIHVDSCARVHRYYRERTRERERVRD